MYFSLALILNNSMEQTFIEKLHAVLEIVIL
jgi:hypothetical protein